MNTDKMLQFLSDLENNNTLEWMHQNKAYYQEAKETFTELIQQLIFTIAESDPSVAGLRAEDLTFHLNRDTRFSHDKSPYNASFRAHIGPAGKLPIPAGYFICVQPSASILGGGVFADRFPKATAMVREHIAENAGQLQGILSEPRFAASYTLLGTKLKNVPREYDAAHPAAEYLKHKSWFIECPVSDAQIAEADVQWMAQQCLLMKPLNDFLNEALREFEMPKR